MGKYDDLAEKLDRLHERIAAHDDDLDRDAEALAKLHKRLVEANRWSDIYGERLTKLEDKLAYTATPAPKPGLSTVNDVPADGTVEIRFQSNVTCDGWSPWRHVTGERTSTQGQAYRWFEGANVALHRDHFVQVRRVDDDGPFIRGAA